MVLAWMVLMKNNKALGQHWLKNRAILEEIAELSAYGNSAITGVKSGKKPLCVEIGPGLGFLTSSLLKRFEKVIAVEYDADLARKLPGSFPGKNLEVVRGDILDCDFAGMAQPYVIAGNIPYYITSPIIEKTLTAEVMPERVVLLMQKEVAERILSAKETMLSLFVKNRAEVEAGSVVLKGEFTPPPKVDSQVVVMTPHSPRVSEDVFSLIRKSFAMPRKKLVHNLAGLMGKAELERILVAAGVDLNARPGDLHLDEYRKLYELMNM